MDILTMLESAASEIRELRNRAASDETMRKNQTLRVAISQLRGNIIDYADADKTEWDTLNELIDAGRVGMAHTGEVLCDMRILTKDQLREIIQANAHVEPAAARSTHQNQ